MPTIEPPRFWIKKVQLFSKLRSDYTKFKARLGLTLEIFIGILSIRAFISILSIQGRNMDSRDITRKTRNEDIIALTRSKSGSIHHVAGCVLYGKG